jgi:hypothetical protein
MTVTATYNGEELNVTFVASIERCDYGVEGSPVWYEVKSRHHRDSALRHPWH